jgi:hypothetical protein
MLYWEYNEKYKIWLYKYKPSENENDIVIHGIVRTEIDKYRFFFYTYKKVEADRLEEAKDIIEGLYIHWR